MKTNILTILSMLFILSLSACKESINNDVGKEKPFISGYQFCCHKVDNNHWTIYTNDVNGSSPQRISAPSDGDDYNPQWSPDGKYIVYQHQIAFEGSQTVVYDVKKGTYTVLTADGNGAGSFPQWTPDSRVVLSYIKNGENTTSTYIVNPDDSNKKKILEFEPKKIFFYKDGYNFLYTAGTLLYKTNIDGINKELIQDIKQFPFEASIDGFNPDTEELLMTKDSASINMIALYNINTKNMRNIYVEPAGIRIFRSKYSNDFSKIAFLEDDKEDYLAVLENGVRKRLVSSIGDVITERFSYMPMEFSPDDKFIAFSKRIYNSGGQYISWTEYLFAVNIISGALYFIDKPAYGPSWNPKP